MKTIARCLLSLATLAASACAAWSQQVEIQLHGPEATVFGRTVRISDVAELRDGNPALRKRLAELDIHQFDQQRTPFEFTPRLIHYRAVMAGIRPSEFVVTGPESIRIQYSNPVNATQLFEQSFLDALTRQFQIPAESFELQFITPVEPILKRLELDPHSVLVTPQFSPELPLGTRSIEVLLTDTRQQSHSEPVTVKIAVYRDLVMAKENISRGEVIEAAQLERVRRPVDSPQIRFASFEQAIGKRATNDIQQFSLVKSQFVRDVGTRSGAGQFDVKRNQSLHVIIRRGPLVVTLQDARALENGKIGDYIDLLNPKSKERVRAKILDAKTATIEL